MIEKCEGWKFDGVLHAVLEDAQRAAIRAIIYPAGKEECDVASTLLEHREDIMSILSLKAPKERKTRADKGSKRTKKIAPVAEAT